MNSFGIRGNLYAWLSDYLRDRTQQTRIDGQLSAPSHITSGVPQGSVLAPTLFLILINNLLVTVDHFATALQEMGRKISICSAAYADDTLFSVSHEDPMTAATYLNIVLLHASRWAASWGMMFNPSKTITLFISKCRPQQRPNGISFMNAFIPFSKSCSYLGVVLSDDLKFGEHIRHICVRVNKELYVLKVLSQNIPREVHLLTRLYKAIILPHFEYGCIVFAGIGQVLSETLERLQRRAIRLILRIPVREPVPEEAYSTLSLDKLRFRRNFGVACLSYKLLNNNAPRAMLNFTPVLRQNTYDLRRHYYDLNCQFCHTGVSSELYRRSPFSLCVAILNILPMNCVAHHATLGAFKTYLTNFRNNVQFCLFPL